MITLDQSVRAQHRFCCAPMMDWTEDADPAGLPVACNPRCNTYRAISDRTRFIISPCFFAAGAGAPCLRRLLW